ncbi:MAG TPA: hypothetical protein VFC51_03065 [Chloroflexota bacterium]|nr:hypothetical protein [Chloroflexota bacterium]
MTSSNVGLGTFLTFLFMVGASAWFWVHLRYALFGQHATGQWLADHRGIQLLRLGGIPFAVAVFGEIYAPIGGTLAGFHPITAFVCALIGVVIDWILYGIGEGLSHAMPSEVAEPAQLRRAA